MNLLKNLFGDTQPGPWDAVAAELGLVLHRRTYSGVVDGTSLSLTAEDDKVTIIVKLAKRAAGELSIIGPSENAGATVPEVKLSLGDGPFDYAYWVRISKPRDYAAQVLLPHDRLREALLNAPFGTYSAVGDALTYQSRKISPGTNQLRAVAHALGWFAEAIVTA